MHLRINLQWLSFTQIKDVPDGVGRTGLMASTSKADESTVAALLEHCKVLVKLNFFLKKKKKKKRGLLLKWGGGGRGNRKASAFMNFQFVYESVLSMYLCILVCIYVSMDIYVCVFVR